MSYPLPMFIVANQMPHGPGRPQLMKMISCSSLSSNGSYDSSFGSSGSDNDHDTTAKNVRRPSKISRWGDGTSQNSGSGGASQTAPYTNLRSQVFKGGFLFNRKGFTCSAVIGSSSRSDVAPKKPLQNRCDEDNDSEKDQDVEEKKQKQKCYGDSEFAPSLPCRQGSEQISTMPPRRRTVHGDILTAARVIDCHGDLAPKCRRRSVEFGIDVTLNADCTAPMQSNADNDSNDNQKKDRKKKKMTDGKSESKKTSSNQKSATNSSISNDEQTSSELGVGKVSKKKSPKKSATPKKDTSKNKEEVNIVEDSNKEQKYKDGNKKTAERSNKNKKDKGSSKGTLKRSTKMKSEKKLVASGEELCPAKSSKSSKSSPSGTKASSTKKPNTVNDTKKRKKKVKESSTKATMVGDVDASDEEIAKEFSNISAKGDKRSDQLEDFMQMLERLAESDNESVDQLQGSGYFES